MKDTYVDADHWATVNTIKVKASIITSWYINQKFRGQGHAAKLFDEVCLEADKENTLLLLSVEPDGTGLDYEQLCIFYQSRGFVMINNNYPTMIRFPGLWRN